MGERMEEVEVVTKQEFCLECLTRLPKEVVGIPKPNSLTAARLRLADAAEAREVAHRKQMARIEMGLDCSVDREYLEALAAEEDAEDQEVEAFEALAALRTARGA